MNRDSNGFFCIFSAVLSLFAQRAVFDWVQRGVARGGGRKRGSGRGRGHAIGTWQHSLLLLD